MKSIKFQSIEFSIRAMSQRVSSRQFTAKLHILSCTSSCGMRGRQRGTGTVISPNNSAFPCLYYYSNVTDSVFCNCYKFKNQLSYLIRKAVPLQAWSGPEGSRKLRFPDFMTTAQDGGKVVSLRHRPPLPPGNTPGTHFC
jgi:hypothetical protein